MSGGHYRDYLFLGDDLINSRWHIERAQELLNKLGECIKEVDYVISGDTSLETAKDRIYEIVKSLADKYHLE